MALTDYINNKPTIETSRLLLRPLEESDIPDLKAWLSDPLIYTYWGKQPAKAEKQPELLFEKNPKPTKSFHLGIEEKDSRKVIGDIYVYLIEKDRQAAVAIRIAANKQANGYGSEALAAMSRFCFENTELQRLWAQVDARNLASQRMLEKCGYLREGLIRQGRMVNSWCDYYIYGLLRSDISDAVTRIREMEELYDQLNQALEKEELLPAELKPTARKLADYLDSGRWLKDYQLDELGMLPKQLKRGVLSQDGLYDLLAEPAVRQLLK